MQLRRKIEAFVLDNWLFLLIFLLAAFLRLYRIEELTCFTGDQGIDLLVVKRMIVEGKFTLLGSKTSVLPIYNGPAYYYMVLPILYLFKLNPTSVSYLMVGFWLGAIAMIYFVGKELINKRVGLFASFLFSIWPLSVEYSRVSFPPYPTPFFAAVFLFSVLKFIKNRGRNWIIIAGLCSGVMMQLHYFNFFLIILTGFYLLLSQKIRVKEILIFFLSAGVTISPMLAFELRHNFFNTRTLIFSLTHQGMSNFNLRPHYFISFFPLAFIALGRLVDFFYKKTKMVMMFLMVVLAAVSFKNIDLGRNHGDSMPEGWNMRGVKMASKIIAGDAKGNFNVASILDGDTRAHPYRYYIEVFGKKPLGVEEYPQADTLYVISNKDENFVINYPVWEIQTLAKRKIVESWEIQNGFKVFKLEKGK